MTAKSRVSVLLTMLLLFGISVLWSCSNNGGGDDLLDPSGVRPTITGLSRNSANIGDQIDVYGMNFGPNQSGGNVRLNGLDFVLNSWTETMLDITVAQGMESGIVVVTVNNLASQSGQEAQLFIPAAPAGRPLINAVIPDYGEPGDEILISGNSFGPAGAGGQVFFAPAGGAVSQAGAVLAEVVVVDVGGTPVEQWNAASIKVKVPPVGSIAPGPAEVYVVVNGQESNHKNFMVLTVPYDDEAPVITEVSPPNGEIGTAVTISGDRFGHVQSGSIVQLGGLNLNVVTWSNTQILATIPQGATTGKIRATVNGKISNEIDFVVANTPVITGVSPYQIRVGQPFAVTGFFFGDVQGTGSLRVGGTSQTLDLWSNEEITLPSLSPISASGEQIEVVVTADNGLSSDPAFVELVSDLAVRVSVDPTAGQRNDQGGLGGTPFTFSASVAGGSGDYTYYLIPDGGNPSVEAPASNSPAVVYTYPFESGAPDEKYYDTMMRVVDNSNGDSITVSGPTILVVNPGVPVITKIALSDFNRGGIEAPNDLCYLADDGSYYDFAFPGGAPRFSSSRGDIISGGNPLPSYTRDLSAFVSDGTDPRPYAYRYASQDGAEVLIQGLNFGDMQGEVVLNAGSDDATPVTVFTSWANEAISFRVPATPKNLSGTVSVTPLGSGKQANSVRPLICSPFITQVLPAEVDLAVGTLTVSGFDLQPKTITGMTGGDTYGIWMVRASYDNPFGGGNVTGPALMTTPVPPTSLVGTTMSFSMPSLDIDGNGTVPVEVFNTAGDQSQVVEGILQDGEYILFLWTGALSEGANSELATSGIFSEMFPVQVSIGGTPGDDPPVANLTVNPNSGDAPLNVTCDASGSTDDGAITQYEFDFGEGGGFEDFGMTSATDHDYTADGTYQVRVRVTDDATPAPQSTTSAPQTVTVGGGGPGNTITVTVTVNFNGFQGDTVGTLVRLLELPGDDLVDQRFLAQVDGVPDSTSFEDVAAGDWHINLRRIVTNWTGYGDLEADENVTVPPDANLAFVGEQTADPPPPG